MTQWFDTFMKILSEEKPSHRHALKAMGGLRFLLVVLVCVLGPASQSGHASPVAAATLGSYAFTVNTTADTHDAHRGDGVCADKKGNCSLRAAIEEADALPGGSHITITVPKGTYGLTLGTLGLTANTITIHGVSSKTTIIKGNNTFGIMSLSSNVNMSLSRLTIEGGSTGGNGGGVDNEGGRMNVTSSTFSGNTADNYGGTNSGGGIYNGSGGTLSVSNSTFSGNMVGGAGAGGGIYNDNGSILSVSNTTICNNYAFSGGGIGNTGGSANGGMLSVSNSTICNNQTSGDQVSGGGGMINAFGTVIVSNVTISGNHAFSGGGIFNYGTMRVNNTTISSNWAFASGGGIYNDGGGTLSVSNSTLSGNSAGYIGGGGIENYYGLVTLTGTIVANSPTGGNCGGAMTDKGYNLDSGSSCGFSLRSDLTKTDPMLGPLKNNGGPTQTMALLQGSKAIDWAACGGPATDQRGYTRPDNGESTCDIGAYESAY